MSEFDYSFESGIERKNTQKIDNKYRIVFVGGYTGDFGREWYREVWPVIKKNIERNCQTWTSGGYPISLNDISFEVKRY